MMNLRRNLLRGLPTDATVQKFNLNLRYKVKIPDEKDWNKDSLVSVDSNWSTDGSQNGIPVGAGVYGKIHHWIGDVERWIEFSDSKAITSASVNSKLSWKCVSALNEVGFQRKVTLA